MTYAYIRRGRFLYLPELHQASQRYTQHRGCNEERRWESEEKKNKSVGPLNAPIGLQAATAALHDSQIPRKIADKIASAWDADGPRGTGLGTASGQPERAGGARPIGVVFVRGRGVRRRSRECRGASRGDVRGCRVCDAGFDRSLDGFLDVCGGRSTWDAVSLGVYIFYPPVRMSV